MEGEGLYAGGEDGLGTDWGMGGNWHGGEACPEFEVAATGHFDDGTPDDVGQVMPDEEMPHEV